MFADNFTCSLSQILPRPRGTLRLGGFGLVKKRQVSCNTSPVLVYLLLSARHVRKSPKLLFAPPLVATFGTLSLSHSHTHRTPEMFARRVASSCGIPPSMWRTMHIMSRRQASHQLAPLAVLPTQRALTIASLSAVSSSIGMYESALVSAESLVTILAFGVTSQAVLRIVGAHSIFLQLLTDTMCCSYTFQKLRGCLFVTR